MHALVLIAAFAKVLKAKHCSATAATAEDLKLPPGRGGRQRCGVGNIACSD